VDSERGSSLSDAGWVREEEEEEESEDGESDGGM